MKKIIPFSSDLKSESIAVGDVIELRDFSSYLPEKVTPDSIPWETLSYRLLDSTIGRMLFVNAHMPFTSDTPYDEIDFSTKGMPDVIEIPVPFSGKYRISLGFPVLDDVPCGVDISLDDDGFIVIEPEYGGRYGRMIGLENGREYFVLWQNAILSDSVIRIRIPWGTFAAHTLDIKACLSCLRFERLEEDEGLLQVQGDSDKTFIMVEDGFSPYALYGIPGEPFDLRLNRAYKGSDVKVYMSQIMGPTLWKSYINDYMGELLTSENYNRNRICDVRLAKYVKDSIEKGYDVFRVQTEACHSMGAEMHLSIRANLYFALSECISYANGRFWHEHPEYRLSDSAQLDYNIPEVREFYLDLFKDALEKFDLDGINLDLTRWPRCLDSRYHSKELLIDFCRELRALADEYGKKRNHHINVSLLMVEYYHSHCTLEEQAIDFEGLCASGTLDFICLETNEMEKYAPVAHRYGVKLHGIVDMESPYFNENLSDPLWRLPDGSITDDPRAGEEFQKKRFVDTKPAPFEQVRLMDTYYRNGADGIAKINEYSGALYFRDCGHSKDVRCHAENGEVFGQSVGDYIFITER